MGKNKIAISHIQDRIFTIRGMQVMIDSDLAEMYQVELKRLNEQVKRNEDRFPEHFRFQLTAEEYDSLKSQIATSSGHGGRRYLPYVFTEQGVSMLSAVLRSKTAIQVSIQIMDAFVQMRKFISQNAGLFQRLDGLEEKQLHFQLATDQRFEEVFKALESGNKLPNQGIFFNGQMYDAYAFTAELIRKANTSIILIDNYVDDTVLTLLSKRSEGVSATIYTKSIPKQLQLDLKKHNSQYPEIKVVKFTEAHDRFLILDEKEGYHFGASLKDLGKKWFAFSKMEGMTEMILENLQKVKIDE
ncbi:ORF6N domain-containing protein [Salibacter halophilus]|uniref:ORF6N domain-containing protein n=1 Tax=Salibacter halophilus TaxID=1803916 RepID=A0A6N6M645_9FLAO|nr:ORF6N domain-containing protein [Salibacter halophilus]KAB1065077.1 ORF6N domain-containing protein [Salibacter halophilus]